MPKKVYASKTKNKKIKKVYRKKFDCIACGDTGQSSKGGFCLACQRRNESRNKNK